MRGEGSHNTNTPKPKMGNKVTHFVNPVDLERAKANWELLIASDWFKERPQRVQDLYHRFPPYKFYTTKDDGRMIRVYAVGEMKGGTYVLQAVSAHPTWTNDVIGGFLPDDLVEVPFYPATTVGYLQHNPSIAHFLEPDGWMAFLDE